MKKKDFNYLEDFDFKGKRVLVRSDLNVPIVDGNITSTFRIDACIPTIKFLLESGAKVMVCSHFGRPEAGKLDKKYSLRPLTNILSHKLNKNVSFLSQWIDGVYFDETDIVLLENVRFLIGETDNDASLSKKMAALCDVFVFDAFGSAHREHASTCGVGKEAPLTVAGFLLSHEFKCLDRIFRSPEAPVTAILGGSKASTKLKVLTQLNKKVDFLIPAGGIVNTFLVAAKYGIGKSIFEKELVELAKDLLENGKITLPIDIVVAKSLDSKTGRIISIDEVEDDQLILDVGPESIKQIKQIIRKSKTIIWNGPLGLFENPAFSSGTSSIGKSIGLASGFTIAGGGDTLAAIEQFNISGLDYISTGGGAFLEFLEGLSLPSLKILHERVIQ